MVFSVDVSFTVMGRNPPTAAPTVTVDGPVQFVAGAFVAMVDH